MDCNECLRRYGLWGVSIAILVIAAAYYPRFIKDVSGLALYAHGAECMLKNAVLIDCRGTMWGDYFSYPPIVAFLMLPVVPLPPGARLLVWYVISVGATVWAYVLCEKLARRLFPGPWSEIELACLRVTAIVLSLKALLGVLENQAYDTIVFLFILTGLWGFATGRTVMTGAGFAMAAALKATPLIFFPYLILKRRFAAAGIFVVVYLALSFLPDLFFTPEGGAHGYFLTWLRDIAAGPLKQGDPTQFRFWIGANIHNHSLQGVVTRMFEEGTASPYYRPAAAVAFVVLCSAVGLILLKSRRLGDPPAIDGSALVIAMLMLSPMSSRSHFVVLLLPYTVLAAAWLKQPATRPLGTAVLAASFILATAAGNDLVGKAVTEWAYLHGLLSWGAMVLLVYLGALVWRADHHRVRQTNSVAAT
jgi:hypothetical protein